MRTADGLSQRQESILTYIQKFVQKHGYSPSIRDIQTNLNISSTSVVAYNLKALQEKGKVSREGKISRGIRLTFDGMTEEMRLANRGVHQVPLLGVITAGTPLPNPEDTSSVECEKVEVPSELTIDDKLDGIYALRVRGHSMIDSLIDDGDVVLMKYQESAENGQMVAAMIIDENAFTLKKFYHEGDRVRLQPANSAMQPIYTKPENVRIQGRVVGVLRSLF